MKQQNNKTINTEKRKLDGSCLIELIEDMNNECVLFDFINNYEEFLEWMLESPSEEYRNHATPEWYDFFEQERSKYSQYYVCTDCSVPIK